MQQIISLFWVLINFREFPSSAFPIVRVCLTAFFFFQDSRIEASRDLLQKNDQILPKNVWTTSEPRDIPTEMFACFMWILPCYSYRQKTHIQNTSKVWDALIVLP